MKCIVGDFNFSDTNWKTEEGKTKMSKSFIETLGECFLSQKVEGPTHHRNGQNPTQPDLVLTNDKYLVTDVSHLLPLGRSDHEVLNFSINVNKNKEKNI